MIEKVGWVRTSEPERITANKFYNPRVPHDGKYWYISIGIETELLQRKVSRKYEMNKRGKEYVKTRSIIKLEKQIRLTHRKIANARLNHKTR